MTAGRQFHTQQKHYIAAELEFSNFASDGARIPIGVVPKGSLITNWSACVVTAFNSNSASLPVFVVGTDQAADSQRFCGSASIGMATTGFYSGTTGAGIATVDLAITAQLSKGTMTAMPTTGKLVYSLEYIPPNDNKQLNSTFD